MMVGQVPSGAARESLFLASPSASGTLQAGTGFAGFVNVSPRSLFSSGCGLLPGARLCVQMSLFHKDTCHVGLGPT